MTNSAIIMNKKQQNIKVEGEELELNNEEATQHEADTQKEVEANEEEASTEEEHDPLTAAQAEAEQWKDKYIRLVAEFDNYKKRTLTEVRRPLQLSYLSLTTLNVLQQIRQKTHKLSKRALNSSTRSL